MKYQFDILLWRPIDATDADDNYAFVNIGILSQYLINRRFPGAQIVIHAPEELQYGIMPFIKITPDLLSGIDMASSTDFARAVQKVDADITLVSSGNAFSNLENYPSTSKLDDVLFSLEIFCRGLDIPWDFSSPLINQPWTSFYLMTVPLFFNTLIGYHNTIQSKYSSEAAEFTRSLVYNSLSNIYFARDRFEFYKQQQRVASRQNWRHQRFEFEVSYALNTFYLLIYSALDQLALIINSILKLGVPDRRVGYNSKAFRKATKEHCPEIEAIIASKDSQRLIDMLDLLRNHAAHRGALVPTTIYREPAKEPTSEELDAKAHEMGWDDYTVLPDGFVRDSGRETARTKARLAIYDIAAKDVLVIDRDGKRYIVNPNPNMDAETLSTIVTSVLKLLAAKI